MSQNFYFIYTIFTKILLIIHGLYSKLSICNRGLKRWFQQPKVKLLRKSLTKKLHKSRRLQALCRINKIHSHDLFKGRVHISIMCKHPTWLSPEIQVFVYTAQLYKVLYSVCILFKKFLFMRMERKTVKLLIYGLFKGCSIIQ